MNSVTRVPYEQIRDPDVKRAVMLLNDNIMRLAQKVDFAGGDDVSRKAGAASSKAAKALAEAEAAKEIAEAIRLPGYVAFEDYTLDGTIELAGHSTTNLNDIDVTKDGYRPVGVVRTYSSAARIVVSRTTLEHDDVSDVDILKTAAVNTTTTTTSAWFSFRVMYIRSDSIE